ncbi:solute carrier family 22 member 5 [Puntigrus tetrazona]|uniref:solute carrier family 22 member 5 n=1 Tax=Puntigrus tetrazona TaxID=1606681 RepID=UPI001C8905DC|nr:solute carrier family 22 member 5 [Puntigrus tetrazona]XP_043076843.1 solute carrier family 22 member 5 [Puntigrus tetrazona]XP_043076845.1 solute carrier family 22 member 5 [Puntigrus tetrazona]
MGNYDEDTAFLGQKGTFFVILFFLLNAVYISTGLHSFYIVFVGASPSHHCRIADGNLSEAWLEASIPYETVDGKLQASQCWRYGQETVRKLSSQGYSPLDVNLTDIPLETCEDGWSYSTEIYHSTIVSEWDLVCENEWRVPFTSSTLYMGYLLGSLVAGQLSDRFGRRKVFLASMAAEALVMLVQSFSDSWLLFCVLYFFVGTVQISLYITAFVLGSEVLSESLRVVFTTLGASLHYCIGYMVLPWMAFFVRDWRTLLRVLSGLTVLYIPLWWLIPESPRWLLSQGRVLESEAIVREAAKKNKVSAPEVIFNQSEVKELVSQNSKYSALDVLRSSDIRKTTLLCLLLWMSINVGYFGLSLNTTNLSGDPFLNCFLSAVTEVPAYIVSTFLLKSCPRRPVLTAFLLIGGGFLLLVQLIPESLKTLALALEMAGKFGFTMSFAVVYIYTTELYPTVLRTLGLGLCSSAARIGSITAPYVIFLGTFNKYLPYVLMGSLTIASSIANMFLPETFEKVLPETLEQMQKCKRFMRRNKRTLEEQS